MSITSERIEAANGTSCFRVFFDAMKTHKSKIGKALLWSSLALVIIIALAGVIGGSLFLGCCIEFSYALPAILDGLFEQIFAALLL